MLKPYKIRIDHAALTAGERGRTISVKNPEFTWAVACDRAGAYQSQYKIEVVCRGELLWSSGWVYSKTQSARYAGKAFPCGYTVEISLTIRDDKGEESESVADYFYYAALESWDAPWICAAEDIKRRPRLFRKVIDAASGLRGAVMYVSGIGYHHVSVNGMSPDDAVMDPQWTDYTARVPFVFLAEPGLHEGANVVEIAVADGWRHIDSPFLNKHVGEQGPRFGGIPQLSAIIELRYSDGHTERITTDESWQTSYYELTESNIYDGETYDASKSARNFENAVCCAAPGGRMEVMTLEPIREQEVYPALSIYSPREGMYVADFGQNLAGVVRLRLPRNMKAGQRITLRHAEFLDEDGTLYTAPLREAKATDCYIASGDSRDLEVWQPQFTYHGFRYVAIEGLCEPLDRHDVESVALYTDIASDSFFSCGSAIINAIQKNVVQTEKSNIHSVLTDCPQRDERLGWMNDATVRFEETPYNFDIGHIFPKLIRDLRDVQTINGNGAIQCTAPFFVGGNPADPVCSSYLVAGMQSLLFTGNRDIINEIYDGFAAWENCLLERSDNYIVNYSYYGDWASPAYACIGEDGANSAVTPGILMSTGYSYLNCHLLARFAAETGRMGDIGKYNALADKIAAAYLGKWYNAETGMVDAGSQASQAFTLWLGLIPLEGREKAARIIHDDLVKNDYKITTGNLATRYLFDMLAKYGYIDDAWILLNREEYPSYGFMIENEATTVWERFELKKNPGMNSHNHPMYGAVGYWFYAYLCGVTPTSAGFETLDIRPVIPTKLLSAQAVVDTIRGDISVRWVKRYGKGYLYVSLPFGTDARVYIGGKEYTASAGTHTYCFDI